MSKALILYDSVYGNTAKIALAMVGEVAKAYDTEVATIEQADENSVRELDLLILGSPTQGGRPTQATQDFIDRLSFDALEGVDFVTFDTRFTPSDHGLGVRFLMRRLGYAAPRLADSLQHRGGRMAAKPEGFIVEDVEGGLKADELGRAAMWIRQVVQDLKHPSIDSKLLYL